MRYIGICALSEKNICIRARICPHASCVVLSLFFFPVDPLTSLRFSLCDRRENSKGLRDTNRPGELTEDARVYVRNDKESYEYDTSFQSYRDELEASIEETTQNTKLFTLRQLKI